jgi:hypothetical protein
MKKETEETDEEFWADINKKFEEAAKLKGEADRLTEVMFILLGIAGLLAYGYALLSRAGILQ